MFTQSVPALAQALSGALPEAALRQLMQALGNCQQPLSHRGAVNLQPPDFTGVGALARGGTWRPSDYANLLPDAGQDVRVDVAGSQYTTNTSNYGGHQFSFPINQAFNYNNYFGGETFNVAGNSTFNNSTHNTLTAGETKITNLRVENITVTGGEPGVAQPMPGEPGAGGLGAGGGGGGAGFGGGGFVIPLPAVNQVATFLKDVTVRGNVLVNEQGSVKNSAVDVTNKLVNKSVTVNGSLAVPTVESASLTSFTGSGSASLTTVTGGTISGGTASGNISYDTYPTATCGAIAGTVALPTGGTFSGTPTGIAASGGLGTLAGSVTIPVPTGGYLDASCKLVLTTTNQTYSVTFTGAPSASISSQGTVSGSVTLTGSTNRALSITTPSVTLTKTTATASAALPVTGASFTATTGSTTASVSITAVTASIGLVGGSQTISFSATGSVDVNEAASAALREPAVTITQGAVSKKLNLVVGKKADFIIYLRPRM